MPSRKLERGRVHLTPEDLILLQRGGTAVVTPDQSQALLAQRSLDRTALAGRQALASGVAKLAPAVASIPVRPSQYDPSAAPGVGLSGLSRPGVVQAATMTPRQESMALSAQLDALSSKVDEIVKSNPDPAKRRAARVAIRGAMPKGK